MARLKSAAPAALTPPLRAAVAPDDGGTVVGDVVLLVTPAPVVLVTKLDGRVVVVLVDVTLVDVTLVDVVCGSVGVIVTDVELKNDSVLVVGRTICVVGTVTGVVGATGVVTTAVVVGVTVAEVQPVADGPQAPLSDGPQAPE